MVYPIDNKKFDNTQDPRISGSHNPLAAPQKPFDINATERAYKAKNDQKKDKDTKDKDKKKDKNGKDIEDDEDKPLPRPMGL